MSITHAKVSAKSDGGDSSLVLPSDWNAGHVIDIPGLAGSPDRAPGGGNDDEFDTTDTSDPMTGWTTVGSPAAHDMNSTVLSHYYLQKTATAAGWVGIRKAWTPSNGSTVTCKLSDFRLREENNLVGFFIGVSSPGQLMGLHVGIYSGAYRLLSFNMNSPTSFSSENTAGGISWNTITPLYLRMTYNSSTSVTMEWSYSGLLFKPYSSAVNPGFTVGSAGLFVETGDSTTSDVAAVFDWIRFT